MYGEGRGKKAEGWDSDVGAAQDGVILQFNVSEKVGIFERSHATPFIGRGDYVTCIK